MFFSHDTVVVFEPGLGLRAVKNFQEDIIEPGTPTRMEIRITAPVTTISPAFP
jgi:hypothetical protein